MLEVKLLGKFEVRLDGQPVEMSLRAAQSLLAYLMLNAVTPYRREQLAGLFWPDMPDSKAKANLRQTLSRLRKGIGEQYLVADDLTIAFDATADYWLDAQVLARKVEASTSTVDLIEAVSVYDGELLPGFYEEWVSLEREQLRAAFEHKMSLLLDRLVEAQQWEEVLEWSERWIALGHIPEAAYRALINAYGARGDVSTAMQVYQRCEEALRRDLDVEPSPQTRAALERTKRETPNPFDLLPKRPRTNLPASLSSFIGREKEIVEVRRLIVAHRAVTLAGSGGAGKTRLAIESASGLVEHFADGVWLIEFAPLSDAALVPHEVASTLGLLETGGRLLIMALIDVLREKQRLLIFDNCEHLIDACAQLASALLQACPQVHILCTSRELLDIPGEIPFRVPPLSTPDAQHPHTIQELADYEAVRLFVERGAAAVAAYALTADNAAAIARICQRLDGMPLAIELAAARLKTLRAEEIAARLDDRFHLLTGGSRTALPRQQTLRATIEWSYNLLSEAERILLQRLSVFAGGWTLEAAESVGADPRVGPGADTSPARLSAGELGASWGRINPYAVMDVLTNLADKSLVNIERAQGQETRYRMLETIRQYAREKLNASGEEAVLRQRHLVYYMQLAERIEPELVGPDQFEWLDRLEAEFDNMRTALECALIADVKSGLRLASALRRFWYGSGHVDESINYLSRLLQASIPQAVVEIRANALAVLSELMTVHNELRSQQLAEESLALQRATGDERGETLALLMLAQAFMYQGQADEARQLCERCLTLSWSSNDPIREGEALVQMALTFPILPRRVELLQDAQAIFRDHSHWTGLRVTLNLLSQVAIWQGNYARARHWLDELTELKPQVTASAEQLAIEMRLLGRLALREGDCRRAAKELAESAQLFQEIGQKMNSCWSLSDLGYAALRQGDLQHARHLWEQNLPKFRVANFTIGVVYNVEGLASLAVQQGRPARAARLFAWADATRQAIEDPRPPVEQADVEGDLAIVHAQLDGATFQAEQAAGRALTMDEAILYALGEEVVN